MDLKLNTRYTGSDFPLNGIHAIIDAFASQLSHQEICELKLLFDLDVEADYIIDFLYNHRMTFLCEPLGLGLPCGPRTFRSQRRRRNCTPMLPFIGQSSEPISMESNEIEEVENVIQHNEQMVTLLSLAPTEDEYTYTAHDHSSDTLAKWLCRPRNVANFNWTIGTDFHERINIWDLFLSSGPGATGLIEKMNKYFLLRGKLRVQFKINGSPFHYGRIRAAYSPSIRDPGTPYLTDPFQSLIIDSYAGGATIFPNKVLLSQRAGVFLDPATNQPEEMILPFIFPNDYVDLRYTSQLERLGHLDLYSINNLKHANGATDPASITIFASMIDPVLSTPMSRDIFTGQSGMGKSTSSRNGEDAPSGTPISNSSGDEYGNGIISAPASALASFAGLLGRVPIIGRYATATKMAASAVSDIASLWGFSRPIQLEPPMFMRPRPFGNVANTSGTDTIAKLSLDPKQEITIDPSTCGILPTDQMALAYIFQRESLLVTFPWEVSDTQQLRLCAIKVHPQVCPTLIGSRWPTALAWASLPFGAWRGSLIYRVQIVASQNHRGRLLVMWDPSLGSFANGPNTAERYSQILDLAECRDMSICVRYGQPEPFKRVQLDLGDQAMVTLKGGPSMSLLNSEKCNGVLTFHVLNRLGAPTSDAGVSVNVYVRAGDDFMVKNPTSEGLANVQYTDIGFDSLIEGAGFDFVAGDIAIQEPVFEGQSSMADPMSCEENKPYQREIIIINGDSEGTGECCDISKIMYGEQVVSIKSLLHRYCLSSVYKTVADNGTTISIMSVTAMNIPPGPGRIYNKSLPASMGTVAAASVPYHFSRISYIRYFMEGYCGYRGAVRWKYLLAAKNRTADAGLLTAARVTYNDVPTNSVALHNVSASTATISTTERNYSLLVGDLDLQSGAELADTHVNAGAIEFEVPWQYQSRFAYCHGDYETINQENTGFSGDVFNQHRVTWSTAGAQARNSQFLGLSSVGEDFSFVYFINAPRLYPKIHPPAA